MAAYVRGDPDEVGQRPGRCLFKECAVGMELRRAVRVAVMARDTVEHYVGVVCAVLVLSPAAIHDLPRVGLSCVDVEAEGAVAQVEVVVDRHGRVRRLVAAALIPQDVVRDAARGCRLREEVVGRRGGWARRIEFVEHSCSQANQEGSRPTTIAKDAPNSLAIAALTGICSGENIFTAVVSFAAPFATEKSSLCSEYG